VLLPNQPEDGLFGQAGAVPFPSPFPFPLVPLVRLAGGADRELAVLPDLARDRTGGGPAEAERPAPRDQLVPALAGALPLP
jgi:hypothetical protein